MRKYHRQYHAARTNAKRRGIPFRMTLEQWEGLLWLVLGPRWQKKYGRLRHQYCVARTGDKGPYRLGNVRVITCAQNHAERVVSPEGRARIGAASRGRVKTSGPLSKAHREKIRCTCKRNWRNQFASGPGGLS